MTSWSTIQETPNQGSSSIAFTSGGTITINAPAQKVFSVIVDHDRYHQWNTWSPRLEFNSARGDDDDNDDGTSIDGDKVDEQRRKNKKREEETTGKMPAGAKGSLFVKMENQGRGYDVPIEIIECTSQPTNDGVYVLSWQGQMMPSWFALSERVQTVTPVGVGSACEVRNWESMSGWGAYVLDFLLGVRKQLGLSNAKYLEDLKTFVEGQ